MKLAKKEKIIIMVLGFVLVFALILMFGIMPANDTLAEKEAEYAKLESELRTKQLEFNKNNPSVIVNKIDTLLEKYYANELDVMVDGKVKAFVEFNKIIDDITYSLGLKLPVDVSPVISEEAIKLDPDNAESKVAVLLLGRVTLGFEVKGTDTSEVSSILNALEDDNRIKHGKVELEVKNTSEGMLISGTVEILKYYLQNPEILPKVLDIPMRRPELEDLTKPVLIFDAVENAEFYEFYEVITEGEQYKFVLVDTLTLSEEFKQDATFKYNYEGKLQKGKSYVVSAVGNYKLDPENARYYRTILNSQLADTRFAI